MLVAFPGFLCLEDMNLLEARKLLKSSAMQINKMECLQLLVHGNVCLLIRNLLHSSRMDILSAKLSTV